MESESLLKVIELLSVQQINTHEANDNTENITVKETGKNKKIKLNHQQDSRIPLRNSFEILPIEECQDKPEPSDKENSMLPSFDHTPSKRRLKSSYLNTTNYQRLTLLTTNMKNPLHRGKYAYSTGYNIFGSKPSLERKFVSSVIAT